MSYFKIQPNDLFVNTLETYPDVSFYIQGGNVYVNNKNYISGNWSDNITGVPRGSISLYEYNINRSGSYDDVGIEVNPVIYPYVVKDGQKTTFKSISNLDWDTLYGFGGEQITSSYNLSASLSRSLETNAMSTVTNIASIGTDTGLIRRESAYYLRALRNTLQYNSYLSPHYNWDHYSSSVTNLISVPSIFYGSSIKKGSINLKYYVSGALIAQASDYRYNGELVHVFGSGLATGSVVGTVLYKQGFILLTSSVDLGDSNALDYETSANSSWIRFGYGLSNEHIGNTTVSASFAIEFQGTSKISTMTLLAKAPQNQLNHSNNPTYITGGVGYSSGSYQFTQGLMHIDNVVPADYTDLAPPFQKETYISKIALYDKDRICIGFAKLATPVRKTEDREFIFKLKLDL